jgi:hypothetical protein
LGDTKTRIRDGISLTVIECRGQALSPKSEQVKALDLSGRHGGSNQAPRYDLRIVYNWPLNLLTFGWWERRKQRRFIEWSESGAYKVWPFFSVLEYRRTLASPLCLTGGVGPNPSVSV